MTPESEQGKNRGKRDISYPTHLTKVYTLENQKYRFIISYLCTLWKIKKENVKNKSSDNTTQLEQRSIWQTSLKRYDDALDIVDIPPIWK